jgi:release factor glutamine methyltransferase
MTIREALAEGTASLAAAGIETPGLDASLLLAKVLNTSRSFLISAGQDDISESSVTAFRQLIKRRQSGECTAYILGKKEFYGLEFLVNPSVLVPRPDTETLVEIIEEILTKNTKALRVLDLCTGCGAIAIALKHTMPELEVWATDISAEALETAKTNAARLLPPDSIHFHHGDLFDALLTPPFLIPNSSFLIITSNPPYIPSAEISSLSPEVRMEPRLALDGGDDGLNVIRKIISRAPEFLCPGGALLLEADPRQMKEIACLYKEAGLHDIQTHKDLSGKERVISGIK